MSQDESQKNFLSKKDTFSDKKMTDSPFKVGSEKKEADSPEKEVTKQEVEQKKTPPTPSKEPEDMFASLDEGKEEAKERPGQDRTNNPNLSSIPNNHSKTDSQEEEISKQTRSKGIDKVLLKYIVLGIIAFVIIIAAAFWGASILVSPTT